MDLSSILIILLAMGGVQARPLFDFLPPVIIDENQQISMDHNSHTTIFFPVGKYATDVHYMIIRIPIFLQPVEDGLARCGEVLHHMNNAIKGKATEAPIKDIIKFHNDTFHRVNFNYKKHVAKSTRGAVYSIWFKEETFSRSSIWNRWDGIRSSQSNRNHKNQLYNCKEHSQNRHDGRYSTTA